MEVCVFVSKPRSGATVIRRMLGDHTEIFDCGEIFNEENPSSFFHFAAARIREDGQWAFPSRLRRLFRDYVAAIAAKAPQWKPGARVLIIDVKYDHFNIVHDAWSEMNAHPALVDEIKGAGWRVIHLVRADIAASVISNFIAQRTGVYHVEASAEAAEGDAAPTERATIDIDAALHNCATILDEIATVEKLFSDNSGFLRIDYENVFTSDGDAFGPETLARLADFLGVPDSFDATPKLTKVLKGEWSAHVANAEEVRVALARFGR